MTVLTKLEKHLPFTRIWERERERAQRKVGNFGLYHHWMQWKSKVQKRCKTWGVTPGVIWAKPYIGWQVTHTMGLEPMTSSSILLLQGKEESFELELIGYFGLLFKFVNEFLLHILFH